MGNQYPMETLRGFTEAIRPPDAVLYSSPNRITDDKEVRRISFSKTPFDYFEYYWAHYMEEPRIMAVLGWSLKLLFWKTPSNSLKKHVWVVRAAISLFVGLILAISVFGYLNYQEHINGLLSATIFGVSLVVIFKIIWSLISATVVGAVQSSIGDVIKYTIPSPENISVREKIRKNGMELLRNLHVAKKDNGNAKYEKIILIGHSLGTIVAYDILTSLFAEYHLDYVNIPATFKQNRLKVIRLRYPRPNHKNNQYQRKQGRLFQEYQSLGNQWRVSHFITLGSPLTHASMILSRGEEDFQRKKDQREFPISPPQLDHADNHFAFDAKFRAKENKPVTIKVLHHAAHFAMTQWTNLYYKNDWIGGPLSSEFGPGIVDIEVIAAHKLLRSIPLATHTRYWDRQYHESLKVLKRILEDLLPTPDR